MAPENKQPPQTDITTVNPAAPSHPTERISFLEYVRRGAVIGLAACGLVGGVYGTIYPGKGYDTTTWAVIGIMSGGLYGLIFGAITGGLVAGFKAFLGRKKNQ